MTKEIYVPVILRLVTDQEEMKESGPTRGILVRKPQPNEQGGCDACVYRNPITGEIVPALSPEYSEEICAFDLQPCEESRREECPQPPVVIRLPKRQKVAA